MIITSHSSNKSYENCHKFLKLSALNYQPFQVRKTTWQKDECSSTSDNITAIYNLQCPWFSLCAIKNA